MKTTYIQIEEMRKRAKDGKARAAEYYLSQAFKTIDQFRNLLITLSLIAFGFFQTANITIKNVDTVLLSLFLSVVGGIVNYIFSYVATMHEAKYHSKIEKIFSVSNPSIAEYNQMIKEEDLARISKKNYWWLISLIFLIAQACFLLYALWRIIY